MVVVIDIIVSSIITSLGRRYIVVVVIQRWKEGVKRRAFSHVGHLEAGW